MILLVYLKTSSLIMLFIKFLTPFAGKLSDIVSNYWIMNLFDTNVCNFIKIKLYLPYYLLDPFSASFTTYTLINPYYF